MKSKKLKFGKVYYEVGYSDLGDTTKHEELKKKYNTELLFSVIDTVNANDYDAIVLYKDKGYESFVKYSTGELGLGMIVTEKVDSYILYESLEDAKAKCNALNEVSSKIANTEGLSSNDILELLKGVKTLEASNNM